MRRIIFPFFIEERHHFLLKKLWISLIVFIYIIVLSLVALSIIFFNNDNSYSETCYDKYGLTYYENDAENPLNECVRNEKNAQIYAQFQYFFIFVTAVIVIHYTIQVILFKIIIDFILLNEKIDKNLKTMIIFALLFVCLFGIVIFITNILFEIYGPQILKTYPPEHFNF